MKAIQVAWDDAALDSHFTTYWDSDEISEYPVLHFFQAVPSQPIPYAVLKIGETRTDEQMSGTGDKLQAIRKTDVQFTVFVTVGNATLGEGPTGLVTQKALSLDLAEKIMEVFGGDGIYPKVDLALEAGCYVDSYYVRDFGVRTGEHYRWSIDYRILTDIAVAI